MLQSLFWHPLLGEARIRVNRDKRQRHRGAAVFINIVCNLLHNLYDNKTAFDNKNIYIIPLSLSLILKCNVCWSPPPPPPPPQLVMLFTSVPFRLYITFYLMSLSDSEWVIVYYEINISLTEIFCQVSFYLVISFYIIIDLIQYCVFFPLYNTS